MITDKNFGEYSVAIRTLGTAGEKYLKLMQSIQKQKFQPKQVVVVLPEGYQAPERIIGNEMFVYCQKGMIKQRLKALDYITTEYTLFCDDDVEFDEDFVSKLIEPLDSQKYACASGPLLSFFPPNNMKYWVASLLGGACVMVWKRKKGIRTACGQADGPTIIAFVPISILYMIRII